MQSYFPIRLSRSHWIACCLRGGDAWLRITELGCWGEHAEDLGWVLPGVLLCMALWLLRAMGSERWCPCSGDPETPPERVKCCPELLCVQKWPSLLLITKRNKCSRANCGWPNWHSLFLNNLFQKEFCSILCVTIGRRPFPYILMPDPSARICVRRAVRSGLPGLSHRERRHGHAHHVYIATVHLWDVSRLLKVKAFK